MKHQVEQNNIKEKIQTEIEENEQYGLDFYAELIQKFVRNHAPLRTKKTQKDQHPDANSP